MLVRVRYVKELPNSFALIIGDAIHNMRCALDHVVWEMVGMDGGTQDRYLKFPTGDSQVSFGASCRGIKTPGQWVKEAINATEAFPHGAGEQLYNLHQLDNADKHTVITPVLRATTLPNLKIIAPNGRVVMEEHGSIVLGGTNEFRNIGQAPRGFSVELDGNAEAPPSIFVCKPNGSDEPAIPMLKAIFGAVLNAMEIMAKGTPN